MFYRAVAITTLSAFVAASVVNPAFACTGIVVKSEDGAIVSGRTLEFGYPVKSKVLVIPAGLQLNGTLPDGGKGLSFAAKHSIVGANVYGLNAYADGLNDQGLSVGLFFFPGFAKYPDVTPENASRAVAPHELSLWLLASFASVEEVKANIKNVVVVPTLTPGVGSDKGIVVPVHVRVRDKTGKTIVIEPVDGTLKVHEAPLGVITNSPTYDWHMTNLRNYINLTVNDVPKGQIGGLTLPAFGAGTGLHGLPGDFSPPSRFVRAAFFSANATPGKTAKDAVQRAFHILNQFDLPSGSIQNSATGIAMTEITEWTSVSDSTNLRWYFRTFEDQTIRMIDLKEAVAAAKGQAVQISMDSDQPFINLSTGTPAKP